MSLMDSLGLGGVFGGGIASQPYPSYPPQYLQQYQPIYFCRHGSDCPLCFEIAKKAGEEFKKKVELENQNKIEYENRCKKYMDNFRLITRRTLNS